MVDVQRLLLAFPKLKVEDGPVIERLRSLNAAENVLSRWREIVHTPIEPDEGDAIDGVGDALML